MKILVDTSVLVAAMVAEHPRHDAAFPWLRKGIAGEFDFLVCTHTLAETFAVLTRLPLKPRIHPATAWRMYRENLESHAQAVPLAASDYKAVMQLQAELGLAGGSIYDALIARAAEKAEVDSLLTLNARDFIAVWPKGKAKIREP